MSGLFSQEAVCAFVGDGKVVHGDARIVGELYIKYLFKKFENQERKPKWTGRIPPIKVVNSEFER